MKKGERTSAQIRVDGRSEEVGILDNSRPGVFWDEYGRKQISSAV